MVNRIGNIRHENKRYSEDIIDRKPIGVTRGLTGFSCSMCPDGSNGPSRQHENSSQLRVVPRLVSQKMAAEYCGMKADTFRKYCRKGLLPGPVEHLGSRWDLREIDALLDQMSNLNTKTEDKFEIWKRSIGENDDGI